MAKGDKVMGDVPIYTERDVVEAVNELKTAVNKFSEDSSRWNRRLSWLTVTIAFLTVLMLVAIGLQIIIMDGGCF